MQFHEFSLFLDQSTISSGEDDFLVENCSMIAGLTQLLRGIQNYGLVELISEVQNKMADSGFVVIFHQGQRALPYQRWQ